MTKRKNKRKYGGLKILWFIIRIPYFIAKVIYLGIKYLVDGIIYLKNEGKKTSKKIKQRKIEREIQEKREDIVAVYNDFEILKEIQGNYLEWEKKIHDSDSRIGIILGARGSGKSAFGIKFLENFQAKKNKKCFAMGFKSSEMPSWIKVVEGVEELDNDSVVLIDEGGILFSSRNAMSNANKLLSELILVARHKNLSILFISQNSSNLDVNILRQSDFLVLKPSSLLQKDFERKIIQKLYEKAEEDFESFKDNKGATHIYSSSFVGFVSNPLPSFWGEKISKSFG